MKIPRWLLAFSFILVAYGVGAHPLDRWHPRNPTPIAMGLNGVAYGDGKFVAVGDFGSVITSTNGSDWEVQAPITFRHLNRIIFANGRFVVVGNEGTVFWSTDGASWSNVSLSLVHNITAIGYGNPTNATAGVFVALATKENSPTSTIALTSQDGTLWQTNTLTGMAATSFSPFRTIAFGNGRFVATKERFFMIYSEDGIHWREPLIAPTAGPVGFGNNQFLTATTLSQTAPFVTSQVSSNGISWQTTSAGPPFQFPYGICFDGTRFVVVGNGGYTAVSSDGTNWTVRALDTDGALQSVAFGEGILVAVGSGGVIFSSLDGTSWTQRSVGHSRHLVSAASISGKCIAAGWAGSILWSSNGLDWSVATSPTSNRLFAVNGWQGQYVFAGESGTIVTGSELTNLSTRYSGTGNPLYGIAASSDRQVIVGDNGTVLNSENTIDWYARNSTVTNRLMSVAYAMERFVVVGGEGTIITSEDGLQWVQRLSGISRHFSGVAFGNGVFVAICRSGGTGPGLAISSDGRDWTSVENVSTLGGKIAFGNGLFVYHLAANGASVFNISSDGRTWEQRVVTTNYPTVNDFAYFNGAFVSVGFSGQIFQSDPVFRVVFDHLTGAGAIEGPSSGSFRIQSANVLGSPDAWMDLTNLTSFPYMFSDPEANNHSFRFYRARFVD